MINVSSSAARMASRLYIEIWLHCCRVTPPPCSPSSYWIHSILSGLYFSRQILCCPVCSFPCSGCSVLQSMIQHSEVVWLLKDFWCKKWSDTQRHLPWSRHSCFLPVALTLYKDNETRVHLQLVHLKKNRVWLLFRIVDMKTLCALPPEVPSFRASGACLPSIYWNTLDRKRLVETLACHSTLTIY